MYWCKVIVDRNAAYLARRHAQRRLGFNHQLKKLQVDSSLRKMDIVRQKKMEEVAYFAGRHAHNQVEREWSYDRSY